MRYMRGLLVAAVAIVFLALAAPADAQIWFDGNIYMKFLWGTDRLGTALYNFTAVPGEGLGDSGQGTQMELFLNGKIGKKIQFKASMQSRFNRNYWTNFGGYFGQDCNGGILTPNPNCLGSEFDPRSNQVMKLRNASVIVTPGYDWLDRFWLGENDLGSFDPFVIGKIRYIDRFNASAIQLTGSTSDRKFSWDLIRISNDVFRGVNFTTGQFQPQDGTWAFQPKLKVSSMLDLVGLVSYAQDIEVDPFDFFTDEGRDIEARQKNFVGGIVAGIHPSSKFDAKASLYYSDTESRLNQVDSDPTNDNNRDLFGFAPGAFSPGPLGDISDPSFKFNFDINEPFDNGLSFQAEYFNIGADYFSYWAVRREADVLLTEGYDAAWAQPGPNNVSFGVFGGTGDAPQPDPPTRVNIGYGGWSNYTVQVPTINADNQYTDMDEPIAESVIGWKGFTIKPLYASGSWDIQGEITWIGYNTNWQMWDDPTLTITNSPYPMQEGDTGVGHNYRTAYSPFRDRDTFIGVAKAKYLFDTGLEVWGKYKHIDETDNRMNDPSFLPFQSGDCPGNGLPCAGNKNFYNSGLSTGDFYGNPPVITGANGEIGYQWKPFDSLADDDRDLSYDTINFGVGKQIHPDFYGSVQYEYYSADLFDGTTAFQAYNLHEMAGGEHKKNKLIFIGKYVLPGLPEAGFQFEHNWGSFEPDFGGGFVPQAITTAQQERDFHQPIGTLGFFNRFGGFNSIEKRDFSQTRFKGYFKIIF